MPFKSEAVNNDSHIVHIVIESLSFFFKAEAVVMIRGSSHVSKLAGSLLFLLALALCGLMSFKTETVNNNSHFCPHSH